MQGGFSYDKKIEATRFHPLIASILLQISNQIYGIIEFAPSTITL